MSGDIEKLAVFDSRIVQSRPKYAVQKGSLSLSNAPFNAISATQSQMTFNIYVPSENVFVDRALEWSSTVHQQFTTTLAVAPAVGEPIVRAGVDFALTYFPLNSLCSTISATLNDTTSVINSQDVLSTILRLTDYKKNRLQRTCPTMLDKYQNYNDAYGAINNPLAGFESQTDYAETPNGAFYNLIFTTPTGAPLGTAAPAFAGASYDAVNGVPVANIASGVGPHQIYIRWRSTEKIVLSPFIFADCHESEVGLFGMNNIQLIMNFRDSSRLIRATSQAGRTITNVGYNNSVASVFTDAVVNTIFMTPSLDVPLPPKSVVPYMEFPRFITQYNQTPIPSGATQQIQSQTITLPQIPDMFIIYAKPSVGAAGGPLAPEDADFYLPLATSADGIRNPVNFNFDNFSGLLSSVTTEQLYAMSVNNGLEVDWNSFAGYAHSQKPLTVGSVGVGAGRIATNGAPLVLRPSKDITLQTGQSPSLVGNFTFQFNITYKNNTPQPQSPTLFVITVNSGFFETIRGKDDMEIDSIHINAYVAA